MILKRNFYNIFIFSLLSCFFFLPSVIHSQEVKKENSELIHFGLFFQTQFYVENHSYGNIYTDAHEDGLRIRRLRPSIYGDITPKISYSIQPLFFSDFQDYEMGLNNAYVKFKPAGFIDLTLGRFKQPFGGELIEDISNQVFPEKSRYWAYLFNENYNNGIGADFHSGIFRWENAFFYSFTDGYSVIREQDFVSRFYLETDNVISGIGFFTNTKKLSGSELPSDIKGNFFISFFPDKKTNPASWKLSLEITGYFIDFESFNNSGEGAHVSFEFLFLKQFRLGNRFSVMYLADNLPASEIDLSIQNEDVKPGWAFDYMLTFAFYFFNQDKTTARQDRVSISYNPGYYLDGEIAHALYIEAVVSF